MIHIWYTLETRNCILRYFHITKQNQPPLGSQKKKKEKIKL